MIRQQLFIGAALLAGVAIGYFAGEGRVAAPLPREHGEKSHAHAPIKDVADANVNALRRRISELESELAERTDEGSGFVQTNGQGLAQNREGGFASPANWLENLKKTDPGRYTQTTNRIAQWRARRAERVQAKIDFFASVDTSRLGEKARQVHADLQEAIIRREELEEQLHRDGVTDGERRALWSEVREAERELSRLNMNERRNLIDATMRAYGLKGQAVKEVSSAIRDVVDATESNFHPPRHR